MSKELKFNIVFSFWFALLLSAVLSFILPIAAVGSVTFKEFFDGTWQGTLVATIVGVVVPIVKINNGFAGLFHLKEGTFLNLIVGKIPGTLIFVVILSFAMRLFMTGPVDGWIQGSIASMPLSFLIAYPCSIILNPIVLRITMAMVKPDPAAA